MFEPGKLVEACNDEVREKEHADLVLCGFLALEREAGTCAACSNSILRLHSTTFDA